jgi:hypothetical protein
MADAATILPGEKDQKIPRRHYSATVVLISLLLILSEGLSLRGARAAFVRCYFWLQRKMPSHTAIRDWIMQIGYYKLITIQKSNNWIGMIDLSIQIGAKKCLLILGVQVSTLLKSKVLTFEDVHVLHMELLEKTSGPIIYEVLKKSEKKVGQYRQFCHDQGSDIVSATKLYTQNAEVTEGRKVPVMNDIAHKIANLLAVEAEELGWTEFASQAAQVKQRLQLTKWAAFCPPSQRSKARYMNLDELTGWANNILVHLKKMESEHQQKIAPHLNEAKKSEVNLKEFLEQFGWVKSSESMIKELSEMLLIGRIVRQKIRTEHLHNKTAKELEQELQHLDVGTRADQFAGSILDFVTDQTKDLEEIALGGTEIIESSFGKLKQLMDEDTKDGFTPFVLSLAACLGKLDLDTVQAALRTCSKKQVKAWAAANVGETIYSQRRRLFNPFKRRKKKQEQLLRVDRGLDHTGFFIDDVVNF